MNVSQLIPIVSALKSAKVKDEKIIDIVLYLTEGKKAPKGKGWRKISEDELLDAIGISKDNSP